MSENDDHHHHHHHHHHKVLDKISNKISSIKDEISSVVKERTHSTSSDRRNSITYDGTSASVRGVSFTLPDDPLPGTIEARPVFRHHGEYCCRLLHLEPDELFHVLHRIEAKNCSRS